MKINVTLQAFCVRGHTLRVINKGKRTIINQQETYMRVKKLFSLLAFIGVAATASADDVTFTALAGSDGFQDYEGYASLFDETSGKWCGWASGAYFIFEASEPVILTGYAMRTGSDGATDNLNRNPKSWTIYGSNDDDNHGKDDTWTQIKQVENDEVMDGNVQKTFYFSIDGNSTSYKYYKVTIEAVRGSNIVQISEFIPSYTKPGAPAHTCSSSSNYHTYSMNGSINQQVDVCDVCNKVVRSDQHRGIIIADGKTFVIVGGGWGPGYGNFSYSRTGSSMGTIFLPYNLKNAGSNSTADFYTLAFCENETLVFDRVTDDLPYRTPAIFVRKEDEESVNLSCDGAGFNVSLTETLSVADRDAANDDWAMVGSMISGSAEESGNSIYYVKDGAFKRCNGTIKYKPFRAYITGPSDGGSVKAFGVADDMEDAINDIMQSEDGEIHLYDLNGRKVSNIRNGEVYIMNGRKVMFNK